MGDKNVDLVVERLEPLLSGVVTTAVDHERAVPARDLAEMVIKQVDVPVLYSDSIEHAVDMARAEAGPDGAVLVTGSLYLIGEVREIFGE